MFSKSKADIFAVNFSFLTPWKRISLVWDCVFACVLYKTNKEINKNDFFSFFFSGAWNGTGDQVSAWLNYLSGKCTVVFVRSTAVKGSSLHVAVSLGMALTQAALGDRLMNVEIHGLLHIV